MDSRGVSTKKAADYVVIDVETRNLTDDQSVFEAQFIKPHPGTKDETKAEAQVLNKKISLSTRGALTDSAHIACIGMFWPGHSPLVIHSFGEDIADNTTVGCTCEGDMMNLASQILNMTCSDETRIVVANASFDLPKIRSACVRNDIEMADCLKPGSGNPVYDILHMATKYFLVSRAPYSLSLDELTQRLGVTIGGKAVSGREIPGMIDTGDYETVIEYNRTDVLMTAACYERMTRQYSGLLNLKVD